MTVRTILHNSITPDGSCMNFEVNMELHYQVVGKYQAEIYLVGRHYDYIIAGPDYIDYKEAFLSLQENYLVRTILADTGKTLGNILLNQHLADEISLLIHPSIAGIKTVNLFSGVEGCLNLKLLRLEVLDNDYI